MVEIIHYETSSKNKTIGHVDIKIPILKPTVLILRRIAHLQSGEKKWFNYPSFQREKDGFTNYIKYYQFETDIHNAKLLECLHEKVNAYCKQNGIRPEDQTRMEMDIEKEEIPF